MAKYMGTVAITGPISPSDTLDTYATHSETFGHGGYKTVETLIERDEILPLRRKKGMVCFVNETETEYRLFGGIENSDWIEIVGGSGGSGGGTRLVVPTLADLVAIEASDRFKGLTVYVQDVDQEYRLMKGIEDINWVLVSDPILVNVGENSTSQTETGETIVHNNYNYNTNNYFLNKLGCINKANILSKVYSNLTNIGTYEDDSGIKVSILDIKPFSFYLSSNNYWVNDSIQFFGTTLGNTEPSDIHINIKDNGKTYNFTLEVLINKGKRMNSDTTFSVELFGNSMEWNGYLNFNTFGPKEIKVYQITNIDNKILANVYKPLLIFSPNFIIYDGENTTPSNLIEGFGISFVTKKYIFRIPEDSTYLVSLVKVGINDKGINTTDYIVVPDTTKPIIADGEYTIEFDKIREILIDGSYALLVKGYEKGILLPEFFYGPFTIILERN